MSSSNTGTPEPDPQTGDSSAAKAGRLPDVQGGAQAASAPGPARGGATRLPSNKPDASAPKANGQADRASRVSPAASGSRGDADATQEQSVVSGERTQQSPVPDARTQQSRVPDARTEQSSVDKPAVPAAPVPPVPSDEQATQAIPHTSASAGPQQAASSAESAGAKAGKLPGASAAPAAPSADEQATRSHRAQGQSTEKFPTSPPSHAAAPVAAALPPQPNRQAPQADSTRAHIASTDDGRGGDGYDDYRIGDADPDKPSAWRQPWALAGMAAAALVLACLALSLLQGGKVASGTSVAGVDVGGLSKSEAQDKLTAEAARIGNKPVTVKTNDQSFQVVPAKAGLAIDVPASLDGLTRSALNPANITKLFGGGEERNAVVKSQSTALVDAVDQASRSVLTDAPKDGSVSFEKGEVKVVRSEPGQGVNAEDLASQIGKGWPAKTEYSAPVAEREGRLKNSEITRFVDEFATKAMSDPVTVTNGSVNTELTPRQLSDMLKVNNKSGKLSATIDNKLVADTVLEQKPTLEKPAKNAKVTLIDGKPSVTPSEDGTTIDEAKLGPAVFAALTSDSRTATIVAKPSKAKITTDDVKALNTTDVISEFRSKFPGGASNAARTKNIRVALSFLDGQVVGAGEQFSLIQALGGDTTAAQGYVEAPTIQDGHERAALGGGVSQVSTTVYNTAFFAGVQLDSHKAHSFWIPRYPMGREATLWIPHIDNKWTNTTGAPILIQAGVQGNEVVMRFFGKKTFTVESNTGGKYAVTQPKTIYDDHPGCIRVPPEQGFSVDVSRVVKKDGVVVENKTTTTTYKPANNIICGKAPSGGGDKKPAKTSGSTPTGTTPSPSASTAPPPAATPTAPPND